MLRAAVAARLVPMFACVVLEPSGLFGHALTKRQIHMLRLRLSMVQSFLLGGSLALAPVLVLAAETDTALIPIAATDVWHDHQAQGTDAAVFCDLALDPLGRYVFAAGDDHTIRVFDRATGKVVTTLMGHTDWVRDVAVRSDGKVLASCGDDGQIKFWSIPDFKQTHSLMASPEPLDHMAFSGDGDKLAAVGFDDRLRVIDGHSGALLQSLPCPGNDMRAVAFSDDGSILASAGRNGRIRVWEMTRMRQVADLDTEDRRIRAVAIAPDNQHLAAAGDGRSIQIWDLHTSQKLSTMEARPGKVRTLAFFDQQLLAAGTTDNDIHLLDIQLGKTVALMQGHEGSVTGLVADTNAAEFFTSSFDTTIRRWPMAVQNAGSLNAFEPSSGLDTEETNFNP